MEKITEQDLKQPDVFVSSMDRFWKKLEPYRQVILLGFAVLVLAGAGYGGWEYYQQSQVKKWSEELFLITHKLEKKKEELEKQLSEKNKPSKPEPGKKEAKKEGAPAAELVKTPETLEKEFGAMLSELETFVGSHTKDRQGMMAALEYSKLAREYQAHGKAQAILEKISITPKGDDPLTSIYFLTLGDVLSQQVSCEAAQAIWGKVGFLPLKSEAMLRDALCAETKGNDARAEEIYKSIEKDHKESRAAQQAKKFMRTLKSKPRPVS